MVEWKSRRKLHLEELDKIVINQLWHEWFEDMEVEQRSETDSHILITMKEQRQ